MMYADYNNCLVNLACSVLNEFRAEYHHPTLQCMDELLRNQYQNIVVLLLDGMGMDALENHLQPDGFFRSHLAAAYSSVFPPTTTAATTSLESGLTPCEHGWLGWSLYFSEIDKIVNAFINTEKDSAQAAADYHVANRYIPYKSVYEKINETGTGKAYSVSKFGTNKISTFNGLTTEIIRLCNTEGKKYIYAYWETPDALMHEYGCYDKTVTENILRLEAAVQKMSGELSDTLLIVTADHGHINLSHYVLTDYPEILKMLKRPISIEERAAVFYVKDEFLSDFPIVFHKLFGDEFLLYSKDDVKRERIFGDGNSHKKFDEFIGDFLAVGISDKGILYSHHSKVFRSNHAGMTEQEIRIPFIAISRK